MVLLCPGIYAQGPGGRLEKLLRRWGQGHLGRVDESEEETIQHWSRNDLDNLNGHKSPAIKAHSTATTFEEYIQISYVSSLSQFLNAFYAELFYLGQPQSKDMPPPYHTFASARFCCLLLLLLWWENFSSLSLFSYFYLPTTLSDFYHAKTKRKKERKTTFIFMGGGGGGAKQEKTVGTGTSLLLLLLLLRYGVVVRYGGFSGLGTQKSPTN